MRQLIEHFEYLELARSPAAQSPDVPSVLSGAAAADVHLANLQDEQSRTLDRLAMRPGYETAEHISTDDIIIAKYPAGEARDAWVKYWHIGRWIELNKPIPVNDWKEWELYLQRTR